MAKKDKGEFRKGLTVDAAAYLCGFGAAVAPFVMIDNIYGAAAAFTAVATAVIYIFTVFYSDVSIYDPYWSAAPPVMLLAVMIKYRLWNLNSAIILALTAVWSVRLTANWLYTYKGIGHEDWRYAAYREKYGKFVFQLISFAGLQFVPTIVVYAGLMSGLTAIQYDEFSPAAAAGIAVMAGAVALELVSDRAIHKFLRGHAGEGRTCDVSVWRYSRHPNYLGEISFWVGMFIYFLATCPEKWYYGLGVLAVVALFIGVSIPMMEKHNAERRSDYAEYKAKTSALLLLPPKK